MSSRDIWSEDLENLLNYSPPAVEQVDAPATYRLPFPFFDRHIDSRLALNRVVIVPSLTADIADVVDREIRTLQDAGQPAPPTNVEYEETEDGCMMPTKEFLEWDELRNIVTDASSVARFYMDVSYVNCSAVGSTLGIHPHSHTWLTVFRFDKAGAEPDEGHSAITNQYFLCIREDSETGSISVPRGVWKHLDKDARVDLTEVHSRFRRLVTYQFYAASKEYDKVLAKMGDIAMEGVITPLPNCVSGFPIYESSLPPLVDSTILPWSSSQSQQTPRNIEPILLSEEARSPGSIQNATGNASSLPPERSAHPEGVIVTEATAKLDDIDIFVRHAWTRSVMDDTTFIVFHCGKYERIGVRHRATGTLFLSNLIDLHNCRDPAYGKIESGLYLLVIRDAMERAHQFRTSQSIQAGMMEEEHAESSDILRMKQRPKTRSVTASIQKENSLILNECDKRDLTLLHVRHGSLNSPSPVAFLRSGCAIAPGIPCSDKRNHKIELRRRGYQSYEYFEILLTPDSDSGATGQVHKSVISITLRDGQVLSYPVIVKIAFHDFQKERLRHEYVVYKYMASQRVKSVPSIFGLFEHVEGESSMMVMSDVGISLYKRELERNPGKIAVEQVSVSREERSVFVYGQHGLRLLSFAFSNAFKQALSEVHSAGVRHYDIRPMNLMIDDEGKAKIIDFDMAKMGAGKHSRKSEFDDLCLLLQGRYIPPNQIASSPTTQSSRPDSDFLRDLYIQSLTWTHKLDLFIVDEAIPIGQGQENLA